MASIRDRFRELHQEGLFVMPNPWDIGTAKLLEKRGSRHLDGAGDLDDAISRLRSYIKAGAEVAYAPGLTDRDDIARLVAEVGAPINILARLNGPSIRDLADWR